MTHITKHYDILRNLDESFIEKIKVLSIRNHAENYSAFIITNNDEVYGIGYNGDGCFGLKHDIPLTEPTLLSDLSFKRIVRFEYGSRHIIALNSDGKVFSLFIRKKLFKLLLKDYFVGEHIIDICICGYHSLLLTKCGEVYCLNQKGCKLSECKCSAYKGYPLSAKKMPGFGGKKVIAISCGKRYALALTSNGEVYSWGIHFKMGYKFGRLKNSHYPNLLPIGENVKIIKINCGFFHSLLLSDDGYLYSFGQNTQGQLGYDTSIYSSDTNFKKWFPPVKIKFPNKITNILSTGGKFSIVRTAESFYYIWGSWFNKKISKPLKVEPKIYLEEYISREFYGKNYNLNFKVKIEPMNSLTFNEKFDIISVLNQGGYNSVFKALQRSDTEVYAFKQIKMDSTSHEEFLKYVETLTKLNSLFSIRYEKVWVEYLEELPSFIYNCFIQMELAYSTLESAIEKLNLEMNQHKSAELSYKGYFIASQLFIEILEIISNLHGRSPPLIPGCLNTKKFMFSFSDYGRFLKLGDSCMRRKLVHTNSKPDIKSDIYALGLICEELFNIDIDRDLDIRNSQKLSDKYTHLFKVHRDMTARRKDSRPACKEILEKRKLWTIEPAEISEEIEKQVLISGILDESKIANNFHDSILFKMFNEQKFPCKVSHLKFDKQDSKYTNEYEEMKTLGKGTFGIVFEVRSKIDGKRYAIKKIRTNESLLEEASKEINFLQDMNHDFVVQYFNSWIESNNLTEGDQNDESSRSSFSYSQTVDDTNDLLLNIKMELCFKTLKDIIENFHLDSNDGSLRLLTKTSYYAASQLLIEIMQSIDYLHKQSPPIIHRDLKPSNILISYGNKGRFAKIGDFGLSTVHEYDDQSHTQGVGTLNYMSPEARDTRKYDTKIDIYSFGKIVQKLLKFDDTKKRIDDFEKTNSIQLKYSIVFEFTKCLLSDNKQSTNTFNTMLEESEKWAFSLDDIKSEDKFNQIISKTETEVKIEEDFIKYFILKKMEFQ